MSRSIFWLFFLAISRSVLCQAPGDEDTRTCRTTANAGVRQFTAQTRILMDTFDYLNLYNPRGFGTRVWEAVDVDGDGLNWNNDLDSPCGNPLRTCTRQQTQNNWLFSQHIRYEGAREVLFNVSFRFTECNSEPTCTKPYVTLYQYNSDSINNQQRLNPSNYQFLVGDATSSRLQQGSASNSIEETLAIPRPANSLGFYLGVRDEGTCGSVERLIVYYLVCERDVDGLVTYPETSVPVRSGPNLVYDAECAANAHNTTTLQVTAFASSSNSDSTCTPMAPGGRAVCQCNGGYVVSDNGLSCEACPSGMYRSLGDTVCQSCPGNTIMNIEAAPQCNCSIGFFRSSQEGPNIDCTAPPGPVMDLEILTRTATAITVRWTRPATTGRSDYFYRVFHSNPERIGEFITVTDNLMDTRNTVTYEISGLVPFSAYIIRVTTHNGVSNQDPNNDNLRTVANMTMEAIPGPPNAVQRLCTAVVWQVPLQPNGVITGYDIEFFSIGGSPIGDPLNREGDVNFLVTDDLQRATGSSVRLRAKNGAGVGEWTPPRLVCPEPCMMNLTLTSSTVSTVSVAWTRPPLTGGITYSVAINNRDSGSNFETLDANISNTSTNLSYTFSNLAPSTSFKVKVTATISDNQDICTIVARTAEGVPSPPANFTGLCTAFTWQPPHEANGTVIGYDFQLGTGTPETLRADERVYIISTKQRFSGLSARIRALTGGGRGEWTNTSNDCSSVGVERADRNEEKGGVFGGSHEVDLIIVAVCTFAVTLTALLFIVAIISVCVHKRNSHSKKSSTHSFNNPYEMKSN